MLIKQKEDELADLRLELEGKILNRSVVQSKLELLSLSTSEIKENDYDLCTICGNEFLIGIRGSIAICELCKRNRKHKVGREKRELDNIDESSHTNYNHRYLPENQQVNRKKDQKI